MARKSKSLRLLVVVLALCFAVISLIACSNTKKSENNSEQPSSTNEEQLTDKDSSGQSSGEGSSEQESGEGSSEQGSGDPEGASGEDSQSTDTVNPPSKPVEESTYSAH